MAFFMLFSKVKSRIKFYLKKNEYISTFMKKKAKIYKKFQITDI